MRNLPLLFLMLASLAAGTTPARAQSDPGIQQVLDDYIRLYQRDTLPRWRELFLPGFVAAFTNDDGSVTTRTLPEFYERQQKYFASGRSIREELQNVKIEQDGALANVRADFVLYDGDARRPGKLMLLLIRENARFKIAALIFTYHLES